METEPNVLRAMIAILSNQSEQAEAAKLEADIGRRIATGTA